MAAASLDIPKAPPEQSEQQSPYGWRGGVDPEWFIVPEQLVVKVTQDIANRRSIALVGASMMGKTSLLKFLASPQCKGYYRAADGSIPTLQFALLDLQDCQIENRDDLVPELARVMSDKLPEKRFQGSTHREALAWIKSTVGERQAGQALWILIFDESDRVVKLRGIDADLFDELRSLLQRYNLCYIIASHQKLMELLRIKNIKVSSFFKEHFLAVWNAQTAKTLMSRPRGEDWNFFNDDDFEFMKKLTAWHPLLLQIGCEHLFNAYRESRHKAIDREQILYDYMQEAEDVYREYWHQEIDNTERDWLKALSQRGVDAQEASEELRKPRNLKRRKKLANLGFIFEEEPFEIPTGIQAFLEGL